MGQAPPVWTKYQTTFCMQLKGRTVKLNSIRSTSKLQEIGRRFVTAASQKDGLLACTVSGGGGLKLVSPGFESVFALAQDDIGF